MSKGCGLDAFGYVRARKSLLPFVVCKKYIDSGPHSSLAYRDTLSEPWETAPALPEKGGG